MIYSNLYTFTYSNTLRYCSQLKVLYKTHTSASKGVNKYAYKYQKELLSYNYFEDYTITNLAHFYNDNMGYHMLFNKIEWCNTMWTGSK